MVNLLSWNLPGRNEENDGGPEGSLCPGQNLNWDLPNTTQNLYCSGKFVW